LKAQLRINSSAQTKGGYPTREDAYRTLKQGAQVDFNITETDKDYQAEGVVEA
jgi:hypothetical protein